MNEWRLLRWGLLLSWFVILVRVMIADYPSDMSLWDAMILDKAGVFHEIAYISAWFWSMITSTLLWQYLDKPMRFTIVRKKTEKV